VLDRRHRLTSSAGFTNTTRRGRRAGTRTLVVHLLLTDEHTDPTADLIAGRTAGPAAEPRVGLVVGKAVGNAVTRNRVKRRLRHLARERIASVPSSAVIVVRALPASAAAGYHGLGQDLDRALGRVLEAGGARR
jgi:ribonuclease P protein component